MNAPISCVAQGQQVEIKSMVITFENLRILIAWRLSFVFDREMAYQNALAVVQDIWGAFQRNALHHGGIF